MDFLGDRKPRSPSIAPSVDPPFFFGTSPMMALAFFFSCSTALETKWLNDPQKNNNCQWSKIWWNFLDFDQKNDIVPWSWWWRWIPLNVFSIMSILTSILGDVVTPPRLPTRRIFSSAMAACVDCHSAVSRRRGAIFWVKKMGISWNSCKRHGFLRSGSKSSRSCCFFLLDFVV